MRIAAEEVGTDRLEADVCVVGAGPVGLTVAAELADAGLNVIVLERGNGASTDTDPGDGAVVTGRPYPLSASRGRAVGGSSVRWDWKTPLGDKFAQLHPLDADDLEGHAGEELRGWPISYGDVTAYFPRAAQRCGLDPGIGTEVAGTQRQPLPAPRGVTIHRYQSGPAAAFAAAAESVSGHRAVSLLTGAYALELCGTEGTTTAVSHVRVASRPGREFEVVAGRYVLASGGIDNARLLLSSTSRGARGLGNDHDWVGKCFMEHLNHLAGFVEPGDRSLLAADKRIELHAQGDAVVQHKYALTPELRRSLGLPNVTYYFTSVSAQVALGVRLQRLDRASGVAALRGLGAATSAGEWRRLPSLVRQVLDDGAGVARFVGTKLGATATRRRRDDRLLRVRGCAEQLPDPCSRVELTADKDAYGVPIAALRWSVSAADLDGIAASQHVFGSLLEMDRVGRYTSVVVSGEEPPAFGVGYHHMGTTRMSASPSGGVVDRDCRVHGVANLYVAGSSVFPTGGSTNPTFTAVALALRLADHLTRR